MKKNNLRFLGRWFRCLTIIMSIVTLSAGCKKDKTESEITLFTATGDISSKMNEFRQALGAQLNTTPGSTGGRREVNWDGVPPEFLNKPLTQNFFNTPGSNVPATRQRGFVYSSGINNFQVSNDGFKSINASTASSFTAFSGSQTFANVGSNLWDVSFQVPGEDVSATIKGFGLVFSDVDLPNSTFVEYFNGAESIGKFFAPVHDANTNLSFLAVYFMKATITHVRVGHDGMLTEGGVDISEGGQKDFVVFDDFLFNEPVKQ